MYGNFCPSSKKELNWCPSTFVVDNLKAQNTTLAQNTSLPNLICNAESKAKKLTDSNFVRFYRDGMRSK